MKKSNTQPRGFTYVELLLVVTIIAILIVVILDLLDPLEKFARAQSARTLLDVEALAQAILLSQVDNDGEFVSPLAEAVPGRNYMVSYATILPEDPACNRNCPQVYNEGSCLNFYNSAIIEKEYLLRVPIAPLQVNDRSWDNVYTGYYVQRTPNNRIKVGYCGDSNVIELR